MRTSLMASAHAELTRQEIPTLGLNFRIAFYFVFHCCVGLRFQASLGQTAVLAHLSLFTRKDQADKRAGSPGNLSLTAALPRTNLTKHGILASRESPGPHFL